MKVFDIPCKQERKKCKTCQFRASPVEQHNCNFIVVTGKMRRCPVENCSKYMRGKRIMSRKLLW